MQLVSSAVNSSLDWKAQYQYIEDIGDGRATPPDPRLLLRHRRMLALVERYRRRPGNVLRRSCPRCARSRAAIRTRASAALHRRLERPPLRPGVRPAQDAERDRALRPAVARPSRTG